jgi:hypothetical protein
VKKSSSKVTVILFGFSQKAQLSSFIKVLPVAAELFHADGQTDRRTDMTKLIVAFLDFANAPKNRSVNAV